MESPSPRGALPAPPPPAGACVDTPSAPAVHVLAPSDADPRLLASCLRPLSPTNAGSTSSVASMIAPRPGSAIASASQGNSVDNLSMYFGAADLDNLPYGWCGYAQFSLAVVNQTYQRNTIRKDTQHLSDARVSNWGFTYLMPSSELYDPSRGYLVDGTIAVKAEVAVCRINDHLTYKSRKEMGFAFLKNQGATCHMNSVIKTLYRTPCFSNVVYHMPKNKNDLPYGSVLLGLHSLLYKFQYSDSSRTTKELDKSFCWDVYDSFLQHDVQGLNGVLFEKYEDKTKGAAVEGTIGLLFEGRHINYIECIHVDYKSSRKDSFDEVVDFCTRWSINMSKLNTKRVVTSIMQRIMVYRMERKGVLLLDFPLLLLKLKQFGSDYMRDTMFKDLWPFPPEKSKEDILHFFILYNPKEEQLCFVKRLLIKASWKPSEILTKLSEMAGFIPYEEIELHEARVKFTLASISYKYNQKPGLSMLHLRLQLCKYFCRSYSSSRRPGFALMEACNISWILNLRGLAICLRSLCSLVFRVLPKVLELSPGLLNKLREEYVHPPLMEIAAGKLPELPREILMDIFALLEIPDLVRAGSVCSSWNSAYTSICNIGQYKQLQTPCLLYTSESSGENVAFLYSLAEKRAYKLALPEPPIHRRYLIGSSHGWVVTVDERSEMHLVNPITSEQIALPSVTTIELVAPIYDDTGAICKYHYSVGTAALSPTRQPVTLALDKLRYYFHHKALVFYDTTVGSYIVVLIHHPCEQLVYARLGDEKWTRLPPHKNFQDCIYKDGLLYAVTSFGEIIAFDLSGPVITTKIIMDRVNDYCGCWRVYIVQAPWGDLLQVWRPEVWIKEEVDGHRHEATFENATKWMEIYKVCTVTKKLVQINSLDDHVLFLGSNQSLCSRAEEYPQLKPNHVYFTDDVEGVAYSCERGYRLNIGVLNFGNKSMEEIIFPRPWSNCLGPLFIIPNPRKMDSALHI